LIHVELANELIEFMNEELIVAGNHFHVKRDAKLSQFQQGV
jgi:hypothetical protein